MSTSQPQLIDQIDSVYRDAVAPGSATPNDPEKAAIRALMKAMVDFAAALTGGLAPYPTVAALNASAAPTSGKLAYVYANGGSPSDAANGVYQYTGAAWVKAAWYFNSVAGVVQPLIDPAVAAAEAARDETETARDDVVAAASYLLPVNGPSPGFLTDDGDSVASSITLDALGRFVAATTAGGPGYGLELRAATTGVSRRETPLDLAPLVQTGPVLRVPPLRVKGPGGWLYTAPAEVTSPAVASEAVTNEAQVLRYQDRSITVGQVRDLGLKYRFLRGPVTVRRASDSAVLSEGVDYSISRDTGSLLGIASVANFQVAVDYTGHKARIDLIHVDAATGEVALTQGAAHERLPSMYAPALPAGKIALYRVFRYADGAVMAPAHLFKDRIRQDRLAEVQAEIERQRRRARPHRAVIDKRLAAGQAIRIDVHGDSISALGGSAIPAEMNAVPNGLRNRVSYFQTFDAAERALVPQFTKFGGSDYVKEGVHWRVLKWLEATYKSPAPPAGQPWNESFLTFRNWAIGGTDSSTSERSNGMKNQGHPDRLTAIFSDPADILIYMPGMNDYGFTAAQEFANVRNVCQAALNAGVLPILISPVRINPAVNLNLQAWRTICDAIARVADDLNIPFADSRRLYEDANAAALGLSAFEWSEASFVNHPGKAELDAMGDLIIELL